MYVDDAFGNPPARQAGKLRPSQVPSRVATMSDKCAMIAIRLMEDSLFRSDIQKPKGFICLRVAWELSATLYSIGADLCTTEGFTTSCTQASTLM